MYDTGHSGQGTAGSAGERDGRYSEVVGGAGAEVGKVGGYLGGLCARLLQELDWPAASYSLPTGVMPRAAGARRPRQVAGDTLG